MRLNRHKFSIGTFRPVGLNLRRVSKLNGYFDVSRKALERNVRRREGRGVDGVAMKL